MSEQATVEPETERERPDLAGYWLVLYDGVCGLCDRTVQFTLKRDKKDLFRFAPLQGWLAQEILEKHGFDPNQLDTVYLVTDPGGPSEKLYRKGKAIFTILSRLPKLWPVVSWAGVLPAGLLDWFYNRVANNRYRWFGRFDSCRLPSNEERTKFVGMEPSKGN